MKKIVVFGCGGHSMSVADSIDKNEYELCGYVDKEISDYSFLDKTILATDENISDLIDAGISYGAIGIGSIKGGASIRESVYHKACDAGVIFPVIIDQSSIVSSVSDIGKGTFVGKGAIINACAKIGECCIINTGAIVEHSVKIGDYSHISVGARLCGDATIGSNSFIGAGAIVIQGVKIGDNVTVGAGAVVIHDISDGVTVVGNPAVEIG